MNKANELLGLAMHGPREEAESAILHLLRDPESPMRHTAVVAAGHVARVNRAIDSAITDLLVSLSSDEALAGAVENALDDVAWFVFEDENHFRSRGSS